VATVAAALAAAAPAGATSQPVPGVVVYSAEEVLRLYVHFEGSQAVLDAPDGTQWPLVTAPGQAGLSNTGDGRYHAMPESEVCAALRGVDFPLSRVPAQVFILPYPRRDVPASAAGSGCLFLAPGVQEYGREEVHFVVTHELGHLVQAALLPDDDASGWNRYRELRGITDTNVYCAGAAHADRPHEIFAEDFRFLFGDDASRYSAGIENGSLELPTANPAVRAFFLGLAQGGSTSWVRSSGLSNGPNPFVSSTTITFDLASTSAAPSAPAGSSAAAQAPVRVRLAVYGVDGRIVRQLVDGKYLPGQYRVVFDGRDGAGVQLPRGVWFARLEAGSQVLVRKLVLSR